MQEYAFHEVANLFPMMTKTEAMALKEDIAGSGLQEAISLFEGKIIDGRNRYLQCKALGIEPRYRDIETDDPVAYARSRNLYRRNLTPSQVGIIAARCQDYYKAQAKNRQKEAGKKYGRGAETQVVAARPHAIAPKSRDEVGKAFGVGGRTVGRAAQVLRDGTPELIKSVEDGKVTVNAAVATLPKSIKAGKSNRRHAIHPRLGLQYAHIAIMQLSKIPNNDVERQEALTLVIQWIEENR